MTIASGSQAKTAEQSVAESNANLTRNTEFDQVVVLVRLPYLPQQEFSAPRCTERPLSVPSGVSSSIDQRDCANEDSTDGCLEPRSESVISQMLARVVRMFTEPNEALPKKRLSPAAWKAAGVAVAIVLIFIALALLNGGVDSDVELASRVSPASSSAERSSNGPELLGASPKLILAPKSDQVGGANIQPASLAEQESIPDQSEEDASADRSARESAGADTEADTLVDAQVDAEKESPADPAEQEAEDSEVEEQVAEIEPPELEPMATVDESVAVQESPAVASSDEIPTPTQAASDQQATIFPAPSAEETTSGSRAASKEPTYPTTDPSTYQYRSHYEELLSNSANGMQDEGYPMSNPRASIYGWHPSTVRLQPRIEPPPIR